MPKYQYTVVPFIGQIKGRQTASSVSGQLQDLIEHYAAQGWEMHQVTNVNIEIKPGCLAGFFGARASYIRFDQVVFRSEVQ